MDKSPIKRSDAGLAAAGILLLLATLSTSPAGAAELVSADKHGRLCNVLINEEYVDILTDLRVPAPGWSRLTGLANATDTIAGIRPPARTWTGFLPLDRDRRARFTQVITETNGVAFLDLSLAAGRDVPAEGAYFSISVPVTHFADGQCILIAPDKTREAAGLPNRQPFFRQLLIAPASRIQFISANRRIQMDLRLSRPCVVIVQDNRHYGLPFYEVLIELARGTLPANRETSLQVEIEPGNKPDRLPAKLIVAPARPRYSLHGFGGNYCFNIESPVTRYTLDNLQLAWVRTEMTLTDWEPENDNTSPDNTRWGALERNDRPDSGLRREFQLARDLQDRGYRSVVSVWRVPAWLRADPRKNSEEHGHRVKPAQWPELIESIGSYLAYAKRKYGVEPDLFSFNEGNIGVFVLFSEKEHRDFIKAAGAQFAKLGLKTRLLLGDVSMAHDTHAYVTPTLADREAMKYVGALSFHSWTGATAEEYAAWATLAEEAKLPLLVAELGVDPEAWRTDAFNTPAYAMKEARMYQELLLHARPQSLLQWELTPDYTLVREERTGTSPNVTLIPTRRFWQIKQLYNLTPRPAEAVETSSSHPDVFMTAFTGSNDGRPALTLHVLNTGGNRDAMISGIPLSNKTLRAVCTDDTDSFRELQTIPVNDGVVGLKLTARSLLTLTGTR